ncbi:hypothetical protein PPL_06797 [Heterostelium album PN500]|uniref:Uncharacterized protein n=1 Tax=Heterostelium pallidum (strain ATCC 26659 / Pp 5 / PN500) TaxID=670386 RepID=D3BDJ5_HETP5|nr:hypothetical protein PPL_06797 [Heterostelium album PN500]EFA79976.1 hypothetical protein PPL_06797 [Heterostelium album PN500]|eukprot:XP_020432096.1 hypothetical protein PPL_06797 [Heterostelium album PN500]
MPVASRSYAGFLSLLYRLLLVTIPVASRSYAGCLVTMTVASRHYAGCLS